MPDALPGSGYCHTQKSPLALILYGGALLCFVVAGGFIGLARPGGPVVFGAAVILLLLGSSFQHLTVQDVGDVLSIRFGPLPLFARRVRFADIASLDVGRTSVLDGWGIHYSRRGGWVWNLWGLDCVVIRFHNGTVLRIGTDDPNGLARFLQERLRRAPPTE